MTDTETDRTALLEQGRRKLKAFQDTRSGKAPSTTLRMPLATGTRPPGDGPDLRAVVTGLSRDKADIETERNELRARTIALEVESASLKERQAVDAATVKQLTHELSTSKSLLGEALQRNDTLIAKAQESLKGLEKAEIDKVELLALLRQREGPSVTFTQTKVSRFEETSSLPTSASSSLMELLPSLDDALDKRTDGVLQKRIQKLETQVTMLSRENNDLKIAAPPSHLALSTQMDDTDWKGKYETLLREKTGLAQDLESYISQESAFKDREARLLKEVAELKKSLQVTDSNDAHKKDSSPPLLEIDTGKVSGLKRELEEKDDEIEVLKTQLLHIQVTVEQLQNQIALLGDANAAMKKELEEERKITTLLSAELEALPDYIELFHRERKTLMNMYNQVVAEKDALLLKPELAASPNPIHLSSPPQLPLPMQPTPDVPIQTSREEPSMIPPKKTVSDANNDQKREEEHKKTSPVKSPKESPEVAVKTEVLKLMEHISKPAQPHPASVSPANRVIYESPSQIVEDLPSPKSTPDPVFLVQTMAPLQTTRSEVPVQSPLPSSHQDALASPEETNLEEVDEEDKPLSRAASELLLVSNAQDDANDPVINMSKIKNIKFDLVNGFAHEPILPNVSNRIPLEDATQTVILPICHQCQYYQDIHI